MTETKSIKIPISVHKTIKLMAVQNDISIAEMVQLVVDRYLSRPGGA